MNVLEIATNQFRNRLAGELQFVEVDEWKDEKGNPIKIYFKSSMNFKQLQKVMKATQEGNQGEAILQTLILRALDEDGKPLFRQADMPDLLRQVDPEVVNKIVIAINSNEDNLEELKKT